MLGPAKEQLEALLSARGMQKSIIPLPQQTNVSPGASFGVTPKSASSLSLDPKHKRADSFADAFPHFNSKLLSTASSGEW